MRELRTQWREWLFPVLILWIASSIDVAVTYIMGNPSLEANQLVVYLYEQGLSFLSSMILVIVSWTLLQTLMILIAWKSMWDNLALTFAIGLSVGHLIGAMSWLRGAWLGILVPMIVCILIGVLLDLMGVNLEISKKE